MHWDASQQTRPATIGQELSPSASCSQAACLLRKCCSPRQGSTAQGAGRPPVSQGVRAFYKLVNAILGTGTISLPKVLLQHNTYNAPKRCCCWRIALRRLCPTCRQLCPTCNSMRLPACSNHGKASAGSGGDGGWARRGDAGIDGTAHHGFTSHTDQVRSRRKVRRAFKKIQGCFQISSFACIGVV